MDLKKAIIFVLAGVLYTIILKISHFIIPDIFRAIYVTQTVYVISLLVGLSAILFGLYFIKEAIGENKKRLKFSLYLAMVGPACLMVIHLIDLIRVSNRLSLALYDFSPALYHLIVESNWHPFSQIVPWFSSIFIFYFFFILYKNLSNKNNELIKANYLVLFGTALTAVFRSFDLVFYLFFPKPVLMTNPPKIIYLLGFFIFLFTSLVSLNFFLKLYRIKDYSKILST
jgi:hypothetical protein